MKAGESNECRREQSRLQRIAPATLKIKREDIDCKAAIPLLSPLVSSPDRIDFSTYNTDSAVDSCNLNQRKEEAEKPLASARWQHPAEPFCFEPAPLVSFVCSGGVER